MIGAFAIANAFAFTGASIVITTSIIVVAFAIACASISVVATTSVFVIASTSTPIASIVTDFNVVVLLLLLFSCCYCFY
jgi:hypothetical protein